MKQKISKLFFIIASVALLATHTVQLMFMTDRYTGFFKPEYAAFRFIFGVFAALICVMMIYFGLQRQSEVRAPLKISKLCGIVSMLAALGFLAGNVISSIGNFTIGSFFKMFMAIITASFFLVFGLCGMLRVPFPKVLALLSVPYFIYCLIEAFIRNSGMSLISENVYEIIMLIFVLLFFLYAAKFLCQIDPHKNATLLIPVGFIAAMFCFVCTVPRYIIIFTGNIEVLKVNKYPDFSIFATGVFIAFFCFSVVNMCKPLKEKKEIKKHETQGISKLEDEAVEEQPEVQNEASNDDDTPSDLDFYI